MPNTPDDDDGLDLERTDELPVLLETVVLDAADPRVAVVESIEDTSEHTVRYPAFAAAEAAGIDDLKSDLAARGAKIAALETDVARLTARWNDVEQHLSAKDAEIAALKRIVDDVGAALSESQAAAQQLVGELAARNTEIVRLRNETAARDADVVRLRDETTASRDAARSAEYEQVETDLRAAREDAAKLRADFDAANTAATAALREKISALDGEIASRRAAAQEHEADARAAAEANASLQAQLRASTNAQKRAEDVAAKEIARATALRAELVSRARLVETLQRDLATRRAAEAEPHHNTLALRADLAAAREDSVRASAELAAARAAHIAETETLETRHATERAALEAQLEAAKREAVDAATVSPPLPAFEIIAQLEAEVEFKRQQVNAQLVALRERDERIAELEHALDTAKHDLTTAQSALDTARSDTGRLERALVERDRTLEAKDARIATLQEEINQRLGALQKLNAMDLSLQGLDSRMSERLRQVDQLPVDNLNTPALVCLTGDAPKQFALTKPSSVIGRGAHCDVQVLTHFVSREHARINVVRGNAVIEDLGSTNGVFVNSIRIDRHELRQGDLITVGETQFRFLESMAH